MKTDSVVAVYELDMLVQKSAYGQYVAFFDVLPDVIGFADTETKAIAALMNAMACYADVMADSDEEVFPGTLFEA